LRRHAAAYFIEPVLAHHDPARVEVYCYAEVETPDDVTVRLRGLVEHWRDTAGLSDEAVANLVHRDGIDVLVDLAGHTTGNRLLVFARRLAPVQLSYLGYPHATGLAAIPFLVGDAVTDPEREPAAAGEDVVRLPGCFCCYAPPREVAPSPDLPADRAGEVTFIALHKLENLNDAVLDLWARVLETVPGSRLLLARDSLHGRTAERLAGRFAERGVASARLVLERVSPEGQAHLRTYDRGDVALDVFPSNGHTTACEALWMGLPVVALRGSHHAARMTASVLACLGLEELVADTPEGYVQIAAALAADRARRAELRAELRQRMLASPLCDGAGLARRLEEAYARLWHGTASAEG
jgi:predicted O-linked N-acetylglucosamine transferase (SPINDLY family)